MKSRPLSFTEQRMLFLRGLYPESSLYHFPLLLEIEGEVAPDDMEAALGKLVDRHQSLRTVYPDHHSCRLLEDPPFHLRRAEEDEPDRWIEKPFSLDHELPLRAVLLPSQGVIRLLLVFHHICIDGWSQEILTRELTSLLNGTEQLPVLPFGFDEYARRQRARSYREPLKYWTEKLRGAPQLSTLPGRIPRPTSRSNSAAELDFSLDRTLLLQRARETGTTPFVILLAAYFLLLYRYTEQEDLVIGLPVACRDALELENLVGALINSLPIRIQLAGQSSLDEVLNSVREGVKEALRYQDCPLEQLVDSLKVERDLSRHPVFQTFLNFMVEPEQRPGGVVSLRRVELPRTTSQFDLNLNVTMKGDRCQAKLIYSIELYDESSMQAFVSCFKMVVDALCRSPGQTEVSEVSLLTAEEQEKLLSCWCRTGELETCETSLLTLFENQAAETPEREAVRLGSERLTYRELDERSNSLARYLLSQGLKAEEAVGLLMPRTLELVVSLLAVQKAGGAYLPLDPQAPPERIKFILQDCGARFLLTRQELSPALRGQAWRPVDPADHLHGRGGRPGVEVSPCQLAYVLYTSGSTGRPKGVAVEHRQITAYIKAIFQAYQLPPGAAYAMLQPLFVDSSQTVLFSPLVSGGSLHLISETVALEGDSLAAYFRDHAVDILKIAPSHLAALQRACRTPADLLPRQLLIVGGETSSWSWIEEFRDTTKCRIFNHYGPTETTVGVLTYPVPRGGATPGHSVPIGKPLPGTLAYILDPKQQPVPPGLVGELYIGGAQVARGYLGASELTEARFVKNPFGPGRLYRTGDRARFLEDGNIEFLGRFDHQVKIRGMRVEPAEVESALNDCAGVDRALVLLKAGELVAYLLAKDGGPLETSEVRRELETRVPSHMVPSSLMTLPSFPRTPHGKIDLNALPEPSWETPAAVPPIGHKEERLLDIWRSVLSAREFGVEDNFFHLGGHSLLAMTLVSKVRDLMGCSLSLAQLFENPTIRSLARSLEASTGKPSSEPRPSEGRKRAPLSFQQEQLWLVEESGEAGGAYNEPCCFRLKGLLDVALLKSCLGKLIERHPILRTAVVRTDQGLQQRILEQVELPWEDLPFEDPEALQDWVYEPFNFERPPLRFGLVQRSARDHTLLLVFHHILLDHQSIALFYRELEQLYRDGGEDVLESATWSYADYSSWQRSVLDEEALQAHLSYWRQRLEGAPALTRLPFRETDGLEGPLEGTVSREVDPALLRRVTTLASEEAGTEFMVLLAAFSALLYRYTGHTDLVVGTPIGKRPREEFENTLGFFAQVVCLRTNLHPEDSFRELLRTTRERSLEAYTHRDLPFQRLVEQLNPPRSPRHTPLFQMVFNYMPFEAACLKLQDLEVSSEKLFQPLSKGFDLSFKVARRGQRTVFSVDYRRDLFTPVQMEQFLKHYQRLLDCVVNSPECSLSSFPLISKEERKEITGPWNAAGLSYRNEECLRSLLASQIETHSDRPVLVSEVGTLSYRELRERAKTMAAELGPLQQRRVGLACRTPEDYLVAVVAVTLSGGSYLPLDPEAPQERLNQMLDDAGVELIVEGRTPVKRSGQPKTTYSEELYVMFTSGSTGRPKGVAVPEKAVLRLVRHANYLDLGPNDRIALASNLCFDASTFEIWGALLNGATLVHVPRSVLLDVGRLGDFLATQRVTVMFVTTGLMHQIARSAPATFQSLRAVLTGGEVLRPNLIASILEHGPPESLLHVYGPTENTTFSTFRSIDTVDPEARSVPIGRPISGTTCYVLSSERELVPFDMEGELYLGGEGLCAGFVSPGEDDPARFIDNPFGPGRLYRTGDRVRLRSDREIDFVGRADTQVKWRGFRIEPEEVEAAALALQQVDQARVRLTESDQVSNLVLYFTASEQLDPVWLRAHLKSLLPAWMVPSQLVQLESFPRNANQKVDLPGLSAVVTAKSPAPVEEERLGQLLGLWRDLLNLPEVSPNDDFFELGGNSLLAIELFRRIEKELDLTGPVSALFECPTPATLINRLSAPNVESGVAIIHPEGTRPPLVFLHGANCVHPLKKAVGPNQPIYYIAPNWSESKLPADLTVEDLAGEYEKRLAEHLQGRCFSICGFSLGAVVAYEMARRYRTQDCGPELLLLLDPSPLSDASGETSPRMTWDNLHLKSLPQIVRHRVDSFRHRLKTNRRRREDPIKRHNTGVYQQAIANYQPQPYEGDTALWYTHPLVASRWKEQLPGLVMEQGLPSGHHAFYQDEKIIRRWTKALVEILESRFLEG